MRKKTKIPKDYKNLYLGDPVNFTNKELELIVLKWELLRRNKKYLKFLKKHRKVYNKARDERDLDTYYRIDRLVRDKFGIRQPLNPINKFSIEKIKQKPILGIILNNYINVMPVRCETYWGKYIFSKKTWKRKRLTYLIISPQRLSRLDEIALKVNLTFSKDAILKEVGKIVNSWKKLKRKYKVKIRKRFRPKDIQLYIKIWDLKDRFPNITYKTIAKKVYGLKKENIRRHHEDQIAKAYKACCELIDGGYRKITL